ncbi:hypothetical protein BGZ54_005006, partial [Gamsiella multidivaricata]
MSDAGCIIKGVQRFAEGSSKDEIKSIKKELKEMTATTEHQQRMIEDEHAHQVANARDLTYEAFTELDNNPDLTTEDHHAVSKYILKDAYDITRPELITPEFVKALDNVKEIETYKNIRDLLIDDNDDGGTMRTRLDHARMQLYRSVRFCAENGLPVKAMHKMLESRYIRLKYAVDTLDPCGFAHPFSDEVLSAAALKAAVETIWDSIMPEMDNMCITLERKKPPHGQWNVFKNRLSFLNIVLGDVLGVKIKAINKRSGRYKLEHYTNVGSKDFR